eukprot:TRINITY_DN1021_c0_g1_i2.p1 TRINITY_DN1021_c0_g1~~TRINITY_DN1021_c0_g1_i2.p1  ORF type:complete len:275 (+),score=52.86 TRINITY_DN1021_c0_g1_i2:148-972(+)
MTDTWDEQAVECGAEWLVRVKLHRTLDHSFTTVLTGVLVDHLLNQAGHVRASEEHSLLRSRLQSEILPQTQALWDACPKMVFMDTYRKHRDKRVVPFCRNLFRQRDQQEQHKNEAYSVLGLAGGESLRDANRQFRDISRRCHPDKTSQLPDDEREQLTGHFKHCLSAVETIREDEETNSKEQQNEAAVRACYDQWSSKVSWLWSFKYNYITLLKEVLLEHLRQEDSTELWVADLESRVSDFYSDCGTIWTHTHNENAERLVLPFIRKCFVEFHY